MATQVHEALTEDEMALFAILSDESGIDILEFALPDEEGPDGCWRAWPFQWSWWRNRDKLVVVQGCRSIGKSISVVAEAVGFAFNYYENEMAITAPELNHLEALTDKIITKMTGPRLFSEMLRKGANKGITRRPFTMHFRHGGRIIGRIPQKDGRGVKGLHPLKLVVEESQDFPNAGYRELIETLKRGQEDSQWRCIGVTTGARNWFYDITQPRSGWTVQRFVAMHRPTWSDEERQEKITQYGSDQDPDYRRNVWGEHGDQQSPIFVLHRLMACVDTDDASAYNTDLFSDQRITGEMVEDNDFSIDGLIDENGAHLDKRKYVQYWGGADIGMTQAPTEIVVYGQTKETAKTPSKLELLLRLNLTRVRANEQLEAILWAIDFYDLKAFGMDSTGVGLPIFQNLQDRARDNPGMRKYMDRIKGYNWSSKLLVGIDQDKANELGITDFDEVMKECGIYRNPMLYSTDEMRTLVDQKRMLLPYNDEILGQLQGQRYTHTKSNVDSYGRKSYTAGSFHIFDGMRMAVMCWAHEEIDRMLNEHQKTKRKEKRPGPVVPQWA